MTPLPPRDQRHIWIRYQVNRVHILDFKGLTSDMRKDLAKRMKMVYTRDDGQEIFLGGARRSMTWRQFILALGLHTAEEMAEDRFGAYWDILRGASSYTYIRDPVRRLCHMLISYNISGRGQTPKKAPQPPPPPPTAGRTMPQRLGRLKEEIQGLHRDVWSLRGLVERSMNDQIEYQRRTRQRTDEPSTSAALQQPDP
ncbi:hypothetical protein Tco_1038583, partial [Tanacetum coccineum]